MTISEKIAKKDENEVHLYKEGIFWVAYEEAAFLVYQVKTLRPTKKYIKSIQQEVVSVGFPSSSLDEVLSHFTIKNQEDTLIVLNTNVPANQAAFQKWKGEMELRTQAQPQARQVVVCNDENTDLLLERIRSFKLHLASPMDCLHFVEELQQEFC